MADKAKLQGSFGSLLDTLTNRFDPLQPAEVVAEWTAAMARSASCARNTGGWDNLPDSRDDYDFVIHALDEATRALVMADYNDPASVMRALAVVSTALDRLEALLAR